MMVGKRNYGTPFHKYICAHCGGVFRAYPHAQQKYCQRTCMNHSEDLFPDAIKLYCEENFSTFGDVYFIQEGESGAIKIGLASDIQKRKMALQVGNPRLLHLLLLLSGGHQLEVELHELFDDYRIRGEWFEPVPELLDFIDSCSLT